MKKPRCLTQQEFDAIPKFYKELGTEAILSYHSRVKRKISTSHWMIKLDGVKFYFWRWWFDMFTEKYARDSKQEITHNMSRWRYRGELKETLNFNSFNKPLNRKHGTK